MFGIGMPEMILILAVALIVIGPKKLPDLAKSLGRAMGEFKKATSDLKQSMEADTGLSDVKETLDDINKDLKESITFDNLEDYQPASSSPAASAAEDSDKGTPLSEENQTGADQMEGDGFKERKSDSEAMADLKNAFDEMNAIVDEPPPSTETEPPGVKPEPETTEEGKRHDE